MIELALAAVALGLAGIDPAGLVIALCALAAGVRERVVIGFVLIVVVGTALLGTALTLTVGHQLQDVDWASLLPPDRLGAVVELGVAAALLVWAVIRVRRPGARPPRPARTSRTGATLLWAGAAFALSAPHARAVTWLQDLLPRARPVLGRVGTVTVGLAGAVLTVDAVWWFASGRFLLPDPT